MRSLRFNYKHFIINKFESYWSSPVIFVNDYSIIGGVFLKFIYFLRKTDYAIYLSGCSFYTIIIRQNYYKCKAKADDKQKENETEYIFGYCKEHWFLL